MAEDLAGADPDGPDGVRMTWNNWPRSKLEASKCVVPVAASIAPIRTSPSLLVLPYNPLRCKPPCSAVLNPFARVDFAARIWICPFCFSRNHFPPHYAAISEANVPGELYPQCTTVEYAPPPLDHFSAPSSPPPPPPVFLFVIDTCLIEEEMGFVKSAMRRAISLVPDYALVGFVTFGTQVHLYELGLADVSKIYVFRGTKEISKDQILDQLGLSASSVRHGAAVGAPGYPKVPRANGFHPSGSVNRFLLQAADCEYALSKHFSCVLSLSQLLDELQADQWPVEAGNRALRCTGVALNVASGLLGACMPGTGARIIALVGGPCTQGPGMIVSKEFSESVRSHKDLDKDAGPHFHKAVRFYDNLAKQLVNQGDLIMLQSGTLEINCSKDIKIQGVIGPCTSLEKGPEGQMRLRVTTVTRRWVAGNRTARYCTVPPKINRRRSVSAIGGRLREKSTVDSRFQLSAVD
ncbi:hypothetical protein BHE74_00052052 [Ensete ventricosum]|nr:hypothetical protein BHE74_00052052 [Ensete ventricosum]